MPPELHPESIRFTSDPLGFDGFRVLVRELPDEAETGSGRRGRDCYELAYRPVQKGHTTVVFHEAPEDRVILNRIMSILPPAKPFSLSWWGGRWKDRHL